MRTQFLVAAVLCWLGVMAPGSAAQQPSSSDQQATASVSGTVDLGAQLVTVTPAMPRDRRQGLSFGALIEQVTAGGPADKAGIKIGDVIQSIDDKPVLKADDVAAALAPLKPAATVRLTLVRSGQVAEVTITLAAPPVVIAGPEPKGEPVLMLDTGGHMALIRGLAFTADGRHLLSAGDDKVVRVWDWASGTTVRTLRGEIGPGREGTINALALSPDTRLDADSGKGWLAVGGWFNQNEDKYGLIRLYDLASGRLLRLLLSGHRSIVLDLAASPDGRRLISGSDDKTAIIWDLGGVSAASTESARLLHRLEGHTDRVNAVAFTPDGQRAVTGSFDRTLKLWEVTSGRLIATMTGHGAQVQTVAVSPRDGTIASGDRSGEIRLWDGRTGRLTKVLSRAQPRGIGKLAFGPDGASLLATASMGQGERQNQVWDLGSGKVVATYTGHDNIVAAGSISPDGLRLAATGGGSNHEIHVWDLATGARRTGPDGKLLTLAGTGQTKWTAGFSADGRSIAWGSTSRQDSPTNRGPLQFQLRLPSATEHLGSPEPIGPAEAADAKRWRLASASQGGLSLSHRKGGSLGYDAILDISRDGRTVASIERPPDDGYAHRSYTFTPDGRSIVSGGGAGFITAYGLDGKPLGNFVGHEGDVWAVAPSPDGHYLVSASHDQTVRLWSLASRELIVTLFHGNDGEWVMWTPQGYFTGSDHAEQIVGWQQGYGPEHAARYVAADQLRHILRRPDIVERAIVLADAKKAVAELAATGPTLTELVRRPPPEVLLVSEGNASATGRAVLVLEVERTGRALTGFDIVLGTSDATGLFKAERKLVHRPASVPAGYRRRYPDRDLQAVEVDLREGRNLISVVARTEVGETTSAPTVVVSQVDRLGTREGTLRILAIGIDRYPQASYPGSLTFAGKDARDFAATAAREMGRRHAGVVSEVLYNGAGGRLEPTKANIEAALGRLAQAGAADTVVLFIAGHGERQRGQYVVLPTDHRRTRADEPGEGVVAWRTIRDALSNAAGRRLVFLDTCHAGNAYNDGLSGDTRNLAFVAFTAAQQNGIAKEDRSLGQGRFTYAVRKGLEGEAMEGDTVEVYDLGRYVSRKVRDLSNGQQQAEFFPGTSNFVLVRR
jgi:WD40 repeat protein